MEALQGASLITVSCGLVHQLHFAVRNKTRRVLRRNVYVEIGRNLGRTLRVALPDATW